jgi:hypothetical protein
MPTQPTRPGRARLAVALALAGAVLAGCVPGARVEAPSDAPLVPSPAAPAGPASRCGPQPFGAEQPEDAWVRFDVTAQQIEVIDRRLHRVLCDQGLWRKGVGFGVNRDPDGPTGWFVMIHPGFSGLTARQILDRLLGR